MTDRTASQNTLAFRDLPADIQALSLDAVGHLPRPMSHMEMLLIIARAIKAERERCAEVGREAALYSGCPADFIADEIAEAIRRGDA